MTDLERQIAEKQAELGKLLLQKKADDEMTGEERIATRLHSMLCHWNHTDGCGWFYEFDSKTREPQWSGHAHALYLGKAQMLITQCCRKAINPEDVIEMFSAVQGYQS